MMEPGLPSGPAEGVVARAASGSMAATPTTPSAAAAPPPGTPLSKTPSTAVKAARLAQHTAHQLQRLRANERSLRSLWLTDNALEEHELAALIEALRTNTTLRQLYLPGSCLSTAAIELLVRALLSNPSSALEAVHGVELAECCPPLAPEPKPGPEPEFGAAGPVRGVLRPNFPLKPMDERKHDVFINHCQKSGQDQCANLDKLLRAEGASVWYGMPAQDLTARVMEQGVANSRNVLVFLSDGCMGREFCQKEQRWAKMYGCKLIGVVEKDERHGGGKEIFDKEKKRAPKDLKYILDEVEFLHYERKDYQAKAMVEEILRRTEGFSPPSRPRAGSNDSTGSADSYRRAAQMIARCKATLKMDIHTIPDDPVRQCRPKFGDLVVCTHLGVHSIQEMRERFEKDFAREMAAAMTYVVEQNLDAESVDRVKQLAEHIRRSAQKPEPFLLTAKLPLT
jgi:hypothetical protein